jgi:hypothetical protein
MRTPPKHLVRRVERAAELRAGGHSWEQIGKKFGCAAETARNWRKAYRGFWEDSIAAARREVANEAADQGLVVLRNLLASDDEKVRRDVSSRLAELRVDEPAATDRDDDIHLFVEYLRGLSDDKLDLLLGECNAADARRPAGDATDGRDPASAA